MIPLEARQDETTASLRWTIHPAADEPGRASLVALAIILAGLLSWRLSGEVWLGLAGTGMIAVAVRAFFLPRTYRLDADGAAEDGPLATPRHLGWDEVRRVSRARFGIHLSPLHSVSRWLPDRGVFLRTRGNRDAVLEFVQRKVAAS